MKRSKTVTVGELLDEFFQRPYVAAKVAEGRLRVVSPEYTSEVDIIMAWRRDSMGEAKSWCLREIPKLFNGK